MKKTDTKTRILVMIAVVAVIAILKLTGFMPSTSGVRIGFSGSSLPHRASGSYHKIMGKFDYTLTPSSGSAAIDCSVKTESGSLNVKILDYKSKEVIFEKEITGNESFKVDTDVKVKVVLETKEHSGSFSFEY
jgi:hypothetical protein